ncbi:MAG: aminotransferase class IV [Deltaproteobacteria bacterium]|nr:aminotransferase class IV [Deltaproteobacteria bacterium]
MRVWCNGQLIDEEKATVSIFDRSYLYGEGLFETLRCYQGRPAFADRHYRRLKKNCERLQMPLSLSEKEFEKAFLEVLRANNIMEAAVRITISTVGASFGVGRPENPPVNISIFCRPVTIDLKNFQNGVKVWPSSILLNDSPATAGIKSTSYLIKMLARAEADQHGAYETLLKNYKGQWVEGSRTNFFIVLDKMVITSPLEDGILGGITREVVLEILKKEKIPHKEDHITDALLKNAEEIFLTGSTSEVMPVCELIGLCKKELRVNSFAARLRSEYISLSNPSLF